MPPILHRSSRNQKKRKKLSLAGKILISLLLGLCVGLLLQYFELSKLPFINTYLINGACDIIGKIFIRLLEMHAETFRALELLNEPLINKKENLLSLKSIKNLDGIGVVEAPRGILMHHYHLNKENSIDQIKLFIATEMNIPLINNMITQYAKKLYEKTDIDTVKKKIQIMIRAFDPCISCATH